MPTAIAIAALVCACGAPRVGAPTVPPPRTAPTADATAADATTPPSEDPWDRAVRLLDEGRFRAADAWIREVGDADPRWDIAAGVAAVGMGEHDRGDDLWAAWGVPEAELDRGLLLARSGRCEEATPALERARSAGDATERAGATDALIACALRLGALEAADALLESARAERPDDPAVLTHAGILSERRGALLDALEEYDAAVGVDPNHRPALRNRGYLLIRLDRPQEALWALEDYLRVTPSNSVDRRTVVGHVERLRASLR